MADIKISDLLPASTPLDGTETLPIVQSGNTVKASTQDIASLYSLGYTAEDVANKSTDTSFAGATDLKYPSQLAVKTYVDNTLGNSGWGLSGNSGTTSANFIGTTDSQDLVLKTSGVERLRVDGASAYGYFKGNLFAINGTNNTQIGAYQNSGGITKGVILNNYATGGEVQIFPGNATNSLTLKAPILSTNKILTLPNTNGTLVATVNGTAPDSSGNVTVSSGWSLSGNSGTTAGTNFIGTTDNQDVVFKRDNSEALRIGATISSTKSFASFDNYVFAQSTSNTNILGAIGIDAFISATSPVFQMQNGIGKMCNILSENITADRTLQLPDTTGTLVATVNGTAPDSAGNVTISTGADYLVYTALITYAGANVVNAIVLKNTIGVSFTWTNPSNGLARITAASGTPFTTGKTWISNGSANIGLAPYLVTGDLSGNIIVNFRFFLHDGTLSTTPGFTNYPIEIRVYP